MAITIDHIVATIHPFILNQNVAVYKEGECIKSISCSLQEVKDMCCALCRKYEIHQIDLSGNKIFAEKIKNKILESNNFDNFDINVTLY